QKQIDVMPECNARRRHARCRSKLGLRHAPLAAREAGYINHRTGRKGHDGLWHISAVPAGPRKCPLARGIRRFDRQHRMREKTGKTSVAGNLSAALQPCNNQVDQVESKLWVLEVEFFEPVVVDDCGLNMGLATHCHHACAVRGKKTYFAE